jgi:hypothetical protein
MDICLLCLDCQVEVSATSRSLVQRSPTDCGMWLWSSENKQPRHLLWVGRSGEDYDYVRQRVCFEPAFSFTDIRTQTDTNTVCDFTKHYFLLQGQGMLFILYRFWHPLISTFVVVVVVPPPPTSSDRLNGNAVFKREQQWKNSTLCTSIFCSYSARKRQEITYSCWINRHKQNLIFWLHKVALIRIVAVHWDFAFAI